MDSDIVLGRRRRGGSHDDGDDAEVRNTVLPLVVLPSSFSPSNSFDLWFDERHGFRHSFGTAAAATAFLPLFVFLLLIPPTLEAEALFCGDSR